MGQITQKELGNLHELIAYEEALCEKFHHYASACQEEHIKQLCEQLADRSRDHMTALVDFLGEGDQRIH